MERWRWSPAARRASAPRKSRRSSREGAKVVFGDIADSEGKKLEEAAPRQQAVKRITCIWTSRRKSEWKHAIDARTVSPLRQARRTGQQRRHRHSARAPSTKRTVEEWDRVMAVNVRGVFLGTKHAIPEMRRTGGGSIVNISSLAGIGQSQFQEPAYATSKAAVRMLSKVTATQHAHENIRCNSLHPGPDRRRHAASLPAGSRSARRSA